MTRDQSWLEQLLAEVWSGHFANVIEERPLKIMFGRRARTRLGSLSYDDKNRVALLRVNGLFRLEQIPESIVRATIVHEMCHYAHGFHSGLERKHAFPHAGGVIRQEFEERGLGDLYLYQRKWLKENWQEIVSQNFRVQYSVRRRRSFRRFVLK